MNLQLLLMLMSFTSQESPLSSSSVSLGKTIWLSSYCSCFLQLYCLYWIIGGKKSSCFRLIFQNKKFQNWPGIGAVCKGGVGSVLNPQLMRDGSWYINTRLSALRCRFWGLCHRVSQRVPAPNIYQVTVSMHFYMAFLFLHFFTDAFWHHFSNQLPAALSQYLLFREP